MPSAASIERRLALIEEQQRRIISLLEGRVLVEVAEPRRKGEPSLAQAHMEAARMADIYEREGREAMKAAFRARNEAVRAKRRRQG
jgi:hypothetical protein